MSLASSASINPALAWSKGPRRFQPQLIRFPAGWTSRVGSVFQWYHELPCQHFRTVQYRKEHLKPFLHEFLLIILLDGHVCRFERMGDPNARTEALATTGSKAHDLVQMFPPEYSISLDLTSTVVIELQFPKRLDIIGVLAICYAIHQGEKTRRYTLQRFNCYFFSWTILTILTRQVAEWEGDLARETWSTTTTSMIHTLRQLSTGTTSQRPKYELTFRICQLLKPNDPSPAQFLLDELERELSLPEVQTSLATALNYALWRSEWGSEVGTALQAAVHSAAQRTANENSIRGVITSCNQSNKTYEISKIIFDAEINTSLLRNMGFVTQRYQEELKAVQEEQLAMAGLKRASPARSIRRAVQTVSGAAYGIWSYRWTDPAHIYGKASLALARPWDSPSHLRHVSATLGAAWRVAHYFFTDKMDDARRGIIKAQSAGFVVEAPELNFDSMRDEALSETLNKLEKEGLHDVEHVAAAAQEFLSYEYTTWENHWSRWVWNSAGYALRDGVVNRVVAAEQGILAVRFPSALVETERNAMSVSQFQDFIHSRIKEHANRVSSHGLGSAVRIRNDIEMAISSVWRSMPERRTPSKWFNSTGDVVAMVSSR